MREPRVLRASGRQAELPHLRQRSKRSLTDVNPDANELRLAIARRCVERKRRELGKAMLAAAVYGSVAHRAAEEHSDVEIGIVCDGTVEEGDEHFFDEDVMVECALVSADRLLASARRVPWNWGIKADAYRHQEPIWDPGRFFERLREAAHSAPEEDFERALGETWWILYEEREKLKNAAEASDAPRAVYLGWEFAYAAAMWIALEERRPYESVRTLWRDAAPRGYRMPELIERLTLGAGSLPEIMCCVDAVWNEIEARSASSTARAAP